MDSIQRFFCGLRGHDALMQFEQDRMFLRCVTCGHESPGWMLSEAPPTPAASNVLVEPRLLSTRRTA